MSGQRVMITGGTGLIGAQAARVLLERGHEPILFDVVAPHGPSADLIELPFEVGDVADLADLAHAARRHGVTRVLHLAAVLTIAAARRPAASTVTNAVGTAQVFELADILGLERVLWTSSAAVYGQRPQYESWMGRGRVTEDDPVAPYDVYGATKVLCESMAREYSARGLDLVGVRPVMTYGTDRFGGAVGVMNRAVRDAALGRVGTITRPWRPGLAINPMYVKDAAQVIVSALLHPEPLSRPVYNLGTGEYLRLEEMVALARKALSESSGTLEFRDDAPVEGAGTDVKPFNYADLDSTALREELDWSPSFTYEAGIADCVRHYLGAQEAQA